jgi:hypothetical protein
MEFLAVILEVYLPKLRNLLSTNLTFSMPLKNSRIFALLQEISWKPLREIYLVSIAFVLILSGVSFFVGLMETHTM